MTRTSLDLFRLDGRHAVVGGGAGLLGPSFAEALLEVGARVSILDINSERLEACAADLGGRFGQRYTSIHCDLTNERDVESAVASAEAVAPVAILINAAAIDPKTDGSADVSGLNFPDYPADLWRRSMEVNLTGIFLITRTVCRDFENRGRGVIVNVSSTYGVVGPDQRLYREGRTPPYFVKPGDYSVTKAGLIGFTRYLAAYYARSSIRVNCLTPGGVYTDHDPAFVEAYASRTLLGRMARREEYKGAILFLCSDASSYMTGANLIVDGGWTAI